MRNRPNGSHMATIRHERIFEWALTRSRTLHEAVLWNHSRELQQMLIMGANPNLYENGYTPLHLASKKGRHSFILLLLSYGADPEATDNRGQTALVIFRKRHAIGPILCLPTIASHDAHDALTQASRASSWARVWPTLPQTAFYAERGEEERGEEERSSVITDVEYTDISIVSPNGEVHLARILSNTMPSAVLH